MADYHYNKSSLKGLGVGAFLNEVKVRNAKIEEASEDIPTSLYNANRLASLLHPQKQFCKIAQVIEHKNAKSYVLIPDESKGTTSLAYFRAGQYLSVMLDIGGITVCKPYTLSSSPKNALGNESNTYTLTIQSNPNALASTYIPTHWSKGCEVTTSGPLGSFYYQSLRDAKNVIALAGGSGITPFLSMAYAIADGIEDFNLTILYGSRTVDSILLRDELESVVKRSNGKVKVVYVLSEEDSKDYVHGFLTAELIKHYIPSEDYSIYVCGPKAMYQYLDKELEKLKLPRRRIRFEVPGEYGNPTLDRKYPSGKADKKYKITVLIRNESRVIECSATQSLLQAMEAAGIRVPSDCRSGKCGWCRSRLISGDVYIPESSDGRRMADKKFGWIHPCATYPISDVSLEVFPIQV